ncbi:MAG TPA: glycosyl hydrolase family 79 C-terminal domain-containing protein [Verrucomicrobiae bacterium]|jgi:hypothetical protein|nr:glycosyl hydrolase family 79 C-terminal domain-containing protein [Verrucomicrobiae bacterium]
MKFLFGLLVAAGLLPFAVFSQTPVTVTVDTRSPGYAIPDDFCGLSFGAIAEMPRRDGGGFLFSPTNTQLIALFTNSGIRNLRLGGSTVEGLKAAHPSHAAIDGVFGFAKAANLDVIYSLPLENGNPSDDAQTALYIWKNYRPWLECFAIGNEPDIRRYHYPPFGSGSDPAITNYASYLGRWRAFAAAIAHAVPGAKFAGPDAASAEWASRFAADEKNSGLVVLVTQHYYVGGSPFIGTNDDGPVRMPVPKAIDKMLSPSYLDKKYPDLFKGAIAPVMAKGMPYRMTESDEILKGIPNASDSLASALWGLDYLHWWAAHGATGVNFHNTEWLKTDTVFLDENSGDYRINPKAYSIRAFDLGSHGCVVPVTVSSRKKLNLSAYAVCDKTNLFVTIINKEHGADARSASVTIVPEGWGIGNVRDMVLMSSSGDIGAMDGITLGTSAIANNASWHGQWESLDPDKNRCTVTVPAASAAVIRMSR